MICEELEKEIISETCAAMKKHSWCDKSREERKVILKAPQALPEIIVQDSQISEITPKEGQSTSETTKTILGHSGRPKAKIEGLCQRRGKSLVWNACLQRKHRKIGLCESCDPNKEFVFSEQPMGQGWHNSAARAGEMVCPELDGRKLKKSTCIMRQGKRRKAGKSCDCEFWKGEKMEKPSAMRSLVTMWCPTCQAERAGWTNQKTHCGECEAELQERQPAVEPTYFFCPTPYCAHQVEAEGMLCGDCQINQLKKVNPLQPDNDYDRKILSTENVKPNSYVIADEAQDGGTPPQHSIETFCRLLKKHPEIYRVLAEKAEREIRSLEEQIVWELREAVKDGKEVEGAKNTWKTYAKPIRGLRADLLKEEGE